MNAAHCRQWWHPLPRQGYKSSLLLLLVLLRRCWCICDLLRRREMLHWSNFVGRQHVVLILDAQIGLVVVITQMCNQLFTTRAADRPDAVTFGLALAAHQARGRNSVSFAKRVHYLGGWLWRFCLAVILAVQIRRVLFFCVEYFGLALVVVEIRNAKVARLLVRQKGESAEVSRLGT